MDILNQIDEALLSEQTLNARQILLKETDPSSMERTQAVVDYIDARRREQKLWEHGTPKERDALRRQRRELKAPFSYHGIYSEKTVWVIAQAAYSANGRSLVTDEQLDSLKRFQTEMDDIQRRIEALQPEDALRDCRLQEEEMRRAVREGRDAELQPLRSRESFQAQYRKRQNILIELLQTICHRDVVPVAKEILEMFHNTVDYFMRDTEIRDRAEAEEFGLPYEPGQRWLAAAKIAADYALENRVPKPHTYSTPRRILEGIVYGI
jgi:hypothetical protein